MKNISAAKESSVKSPLKTGKKLNATSLKILLCMAKIYTRG